jgi:Mycothiol maleylpyruvate isomerase N-terminal domain
MSADAEKQTVLGKFEYEYHEIESKLLALSPAQLERPVWTDEGKGWHVRDLVAHLARWNRIGAAAAELIAAGKEPLPEAEMRLRAFIGIADDVDTVNEKQFKAWRDRPVEDAFTELNRAHRAFMDALLALPPSRFVKADGEPFRYFWTPGAGHLQLHWEHIEAALKETSTT